MMKNYFFLFQFLFILSGFAQTQNLFSTARINVYSQYNFSGNKVYKADSLGNSLWIKDFSGKIASQASDSNNVTAVIESGDKIFVKIDQRENTSSQVRYFPAIAVLDTNGNLLNIKYGDITSPSSVYLNALGSVDTGFVWFYGDHSSGISHHIQLIQVDSNAGISNSVEIWNNSSTTLRDIRILPDSSILVYSYSDNVITYPDFQFVVLDHSGMPNIHKNISSNYVWPQNIGSVSKSPSGETIAFFSNDNSSNSLTTAVKFGVQGNIIIDRTWPGSIIKNYGRISFQNNHIIYDDGQSTFSFDSLLLDTCLGPGVQLNYTISNLQLSGSVFSFPNSSGFVPVDSTPMTFSPIQIYNPPIITSQDYCHVLFSKGELISHNESLTVFPNPVLNILSIDSSFQFYNFQITDMKGRIMKTGDFLNEIVVDNFEPGVYFLKIQDKERSSVGRFIKL